MIDRRTFIPPVVLAVGVALMATTHATMDVELRSPLTTLPARIGFHTSVDRVIPADERRAAGTSAYLLRTFASADSDTPRFSVYVGYYASQTRGRTIHSPRNCLPGAGWEILSIGAASVVAPAGPVTIRRAVISNGRSGAFVYYWYQGRGRVASNEYLVKWHLLRDAVASGRSEEALVRIIVPLPPGVDVHAASSAVTARVDSVGTSVAASMIAAVAGVLPARGGAGVDRIALAPGGRRR